MSKPRNAMKLTSNPFSRIGAIVTLGVMISVGLSPASAQPTFATASATAFDAALIVDGAPTVFGPVLSVSGSATSNSSPPSFAKSGSLNSFSTVTPLAVTTGGLAGNVEGAVVSANADPTSEFQILDLDLSFGSILSLSAKDLLTEARQLLNRPVADFSRVADLTITVLGQTINLGDNSDANDVVFASDGVTITLNQETQGSSGAGVDAIAIAFLRPGLVGSIDIAESKVSVGVVQPSVPEPSTWAMMLIGFAGLGYAAVRRKGAVRAISA
jgi:PEP-CTERM motif